MSIKREGEFNILGCAVRIDTEGVAGEQALKAVNLLENQINNLRSAKPGLKDLDIAVLAALHLASEKVELEQDFKTSVLSMRSEIQDAISLVESNSQQV
jgi:cell division protein ZapA (FtsZ GTPase activity inhibitor)